MPFLLSSYTASVNVQLAIYDQSFGMHYLGIIYWLGTYVPKYFQSGPVVQHLFHKERAQTGPSGRKFDGEGLTVKLSPSVIDPLDQPN